jgi:phosphatidylglycerol:prolipoprotein diacylglycerol transferase
VRPELAVIPQLPPNYLLPLLGAVLLLTLIAVATQIRGGWESVSAPLIFGGVAAGIIFVLSRSSITLHSYGFFLILGFGLATFSACLEAKRRGYDPNLILDLMLPMLLVTVAACRIVYVILNREQFDSFGEMLRVWSGGLSFHGAIPGSIAVVAYFAWTRKIRFGALADLIAPSVFLGYFFGRLGCFFNGCCYGHACDLPWAVVFPTEENRHLGFFTPPSHPAQLYSAGLAIVLFLLMQRAKYKPEFNRFPGQLTLLFFGLYAVERFIVEFFRAGATARFFLGLPITEAQFVSIAGLMIIALFWRVLARREHTEQASPAATAPVVEAEINA